jgi:hypothetical protein
MSKFNHAFSLGFELESNAGDGSDVTHDMLMAAVLRRLQQLQESHNADPAQGESLVDACDAPWGTYLVEE